MHLAQEGRSDEVLALLETSRSMFPQAGKVNTLGAWNTLFGFIEALYLSGASKQAGEFLPLVQEAIALDMEWITFDCRLLHTRAAIAAAGAGEWDQAEEHLSTALLAAEELDHRLEQADLRFLRARMLLERGREEDLAEVRASMAEAADRYRALGITGRLNLVSSMLDEEPQPVE
jgi:hypothetical protein